MSIKMYTTQEQQQVTAQLVQQAIGVVLLIVLVVWGFRNVTRAVRGEPMEQIPI